MRVELRGDPGEGGIKVWGVTETRDEKAGWLEEEVENDRGLEAQRMRKKLGNGPPWRRLGDCVGEGRLERCTFFFFFFYGIH